MKAHKLFLLGMALASLTSYGGFEGGNGGNALVCFRSTEVVQQILKDQQQLCPECAIGPVKLIPTKYLDQVSTVTALDLVEARQRIIEGLPAQIRPFLPGETHQQYADRMVSRFQNLFQEIFATYAEGKQKIGNRVRSINVGMLRSAQDIQPVQLAAENCLYATVIFQVKLDDARSELNIYQPLYNLTDELSKAAFDLHETFLSKTEGQETTDQLRRFVGDLVVQAPMSGMDLVRSYVAAGLGSSLDRVGEFTPHVSLANAFDQTLAKIYDNVNRKIGETFQTQQTEFYQGMPKWFLRYFNVFVAYDDPFSRTNNHSTAYGVKYNPIVTLNTTPCASWRKSTLFDPGLYGTVSRCLHNKNKKLFESRVESLRIILNEKTSEVIQNEWKKTLPELKEKFELFLKADFNGVTPTQKQRMIDSAKKTLEWDPADGMPPFVLSSYVNRLESIFE